MRFIKDLVTLLAVTSLRFLLNFSDFLTKNNNGLNITPIYFGLSQNFPLTLMNLTVQKQFTI